MERERKSHQLEPSLQLIEPEMDKDLEDEDKRSDDL